MKTLYLVTTQGYHDYFISGIFDSKELAESHIKYLIESGEEEEWAINDIEEWPLNPSNGYKREIK